MYHYTESGLRNVWLENGVIKRKTAHGTATAIQDVDGLHKVIGRSLAQKGRLTGTEFRFLRKELDLSQHRLADLIGTTEQTVALWEKRGKIPKTADRMLRAIYLETIDGNVKLKEMIEQTADLDRREGEKMVFHDTERGWVPAQQVAA
ncbi:MAG: helix-turn-helix domain-containing protein [Paraburkholderia sp.]|uniref:helix-turn-helix domain-containing protein n=1 Tax=Paraburkholderia sp. TaxID=1926495 RepID=UPI0011F839D4|nr:helix-turn-helix domain-containing protein [Paraburkholderia sp.]TAL96593.1 MAG: helix-turn-helix domain-containing protein [Paraburkholderia sp.]